MDSVYVDSLIKLALATILGASIGWERGQHGRPAGMRTHALVCLAAVLLIVVSRVGALTAMNTQLPGNLTFNIDPARMAAGIVMGIGFLGAGAILRIRESLIRGLTTAACIWFVAAIGVGIGFDQYLLAIAATVFAFAILVLLDRVENATKRVSYRTVIVEAKNEQRDEIARFCRDLFRKSKMKVQQVAYEVDNCRNEARFTFSLRLSTKRDRLGFVSTISAVPGVNCVRWQ